MAELANGGTASGAGDGRGQHAARARRPSGPTAVARGAQRASDVARGLGERDHDGPTRSTRSWRRQMSARKRPNSGPRSGRPQRQLDDGLEVGGHGAGVVAAALERGAVHGLIGEQEGDGVGELDLAAHAGLHLLELVEDLRGEDVAAHRRPGWRAPRPARASRRCRGSAPAWSEMRSGLAQP